MNRFSSPWTRRRALWFIAGTTGSIALQACTSSAKKPSNPTASSLGSMTYGATAWIGNAPLYIAQGKGFFRGAGEMLSNPQSDLYVLKPMQAMVGFLKAQEQIKTAPDLSNIIDPQFITALS